MDQGEIEVDQDESRQEGGVEDRRAFLPKEAFQPQVTSIRSPDHQAAGEPDRDPIRDTAAQHDQQGS